MTIEIEKMHPERYQVLYQKLLQATKLTSIKVVYGAKTLKILDDTAKLEPYTEHEYGLFLYETLSKLENNEYEKFTREFNIRKEMEKYTKENYQCLIIETARRMLAPEEFGKYVTEQNGNYYIHEDTLEYFKELVCYNILNKEIMTQQVDPKKFSSSPKIEMPIPQNINYYEPYSELEQAILEGRQTSFKKAESFVNNMYAYSSVGNVRKSQEDSYYIGSHPQNAEFRLMLVADGMGGLANGEIASNIAAREMFLWFKSLDPREYYNNDNQNLERAINRQVAKINNQINSKVYTGGTTLCFAIVKRDNILVGNIGDSKAVITEDNKMIYATKSQNVPNMLGVPEPFDRFHVDGNRIIKCLGGQIEETPTCTFDQINLRDNKNYKIMLYSDGVADLLGTDKVVEIAANSKDDQIARDLVHHAVNNKASYKKELEELKAKCLKGEITKENYQEILSKLKQFTESEFYDEIQAGEDNTTAISATIRRGR